MKGIRVLLIGQNSAFIWNSNGKMAALDLWGLVLDISKYFLDILKDFGPGQLG